MSLSKPVATTSRAWIQTMFSAAVLANFFDAGGSIQVLIGDMDSRQYFASRLTRPEIEKHLRTMVDSAKSLPTDAREQLPLVDWQAWLALEGALACADDSQRQQVWSAIEQWLPVTGFHLRQYKRQKPELFVFRI